MRAIRSTIVAMLGLVAVAGCAGEFSIAKARGIVTCNGEPVANALVLFIPMKTEESKGMVGRPARGYTDAEGRFTLGTEGETDGAVIGRHKVTVGHTTSTSEDAQKVECDCLINSELQVTEVAVLGGNANDFEIELQPKNSDDIKYEMAQYKKRQKAIEAAGGNIDFD